MNIPIVILHGWGASARSYDELKSLLEQKGISVFVFDLPGFGNEPSPSEAWSVDDYAEWVREWIRKNVLDSRFRSPRWSFGKAGGNDKAEDGNGREESSNGNNKKLILFGHSFGGRIAIKIAARHPEKLASLILCDAAGITPRPKMKINIFHALSESGKIIFSWPILKYFQPIARKIEYFLAGSRDYYYLQDPVMKGTFRKVIEEDLTPYLDKIKIPTLIIWGKKDKMTPVSDAYIMNKKIAGSKLEVLEGAGHSPHLECPERLPEIIEKFLTSLRNTLFHS